jgi:hypothetical protein
MIDITLTNDPATAITSIVYTGPNSGTLVYGDLTAPDKIKVDSFMTWLLSCMEENTKKMTIKFDDTWTLDFIYASGASYESDYYNLCDIDTLNFLDKSKILLFLELLT